MSSPAVPEPEPAAGDEARQRGAGLAALVIAVTGFSWGFILIKMLPLAPPVVAFFRLVLGASILSLAAIALRVPWPRAQWKAVVLAGLVFGGHQLLFIAATQQTSVAIVTLVGATQPLIVGLVSRRTVGERVPVAMLLWSLLAIAGIAIVVVANLGDQSQSLAGDILAVLNLFAWIGYFLAAKYARTQGAPTLTFTAGFQATAIVVVAPAMLIAGATHPDGRELVILLILVLGPGNGHLLLNWAHPRVAAALSSLFLAAVPLLASIWAHLVLGEPYTWRHVVGMLLVIVAIEGGRRSLR